LASAKQRQELVLDVDGVARASSPSSTPKVAKQEDHHPQAAGPALQSRSAPFLHLRAASNWLKMFGEDLVNRAG